MVARIVRISGCAALLAVVASAASVGEPRGWFHGWLHASASAQTVGSAGPAGDVADVVEKVKPAVVGVRASVEVKLDDDQQQPWERLFGAPKDKAAPKDKSGAPRPRVGTSQGSGFFISSDGYVVTTNHLVEGGQKIEITTDGDKKYPARLIGRDAKTDLALLKVYGEGDFPSVLLASKSPRIGEWVIAVGNPFGLGGTVTVGVVSARARDIKMGTFNDFLQIDAPVNQGNSGGPTFNLQGDVIGVNSAIFSPTGGSVGIGFAIPADTVTDVIAKLKQRGAVVRGWLGVQIQSLTPDIAEGFGIKEASGVLVVEPQSNSPAEQAGIVSGDVITALNGEAVKNDRDLVKRVGEMAPGTSVSVEVSRKGDRKTLSVKLAEMPAERDATPSPVRMPSSGSTSTNRQDPSNLGLELAPGAKVGEGRGVVVTDVDPNGVAADRGVEVGDVILEIDGKEMKTAADVQKVLADARGQGKRVAIARMKSGASMRFVAFPVG